jgi:hypothetical protein
MIRTTSASFLLLVLSGLAACGAPASQAADDGLTLTHFGPALTAGEFREGDLLISFDVASSDGASRFSMAAGTGERLLDAEKRDGFTATTFFGGRVTVIAPDEILGARRSLPDDELRGLASDVVVTGDRAALGLIDQTPEFALLDGLSLALEEAALGGLLPSLGNIGRLEQPLDGDHTEDDPDGGCNPETGCDISDCSVFEQGVCAGVLATCAAGCIGAGAGYVACVLPCLTAAGMVFCEDCL